jgi:hypothetical protein
MHKIEKWSELSDRFTHLLIVGNGASIAVHNGFNYRSLFDACKELGFLTEEVSSVFEKFETSDFELVLRRLWHAKLVNDALKIDDRRVSDAYMAVRAALIKTVRTAHVSYDAALEHLRPIARFMQHFRTVASLNYDLITYWAAMIAKGDVANAIKDGFVNEGGREFTSNWKRLRERIRSRETTMLFYPHGNLVLERLSRDEERKIIARNGSDLLDSILKSWESEQSVPVFVSEGTSAQKKRALASSVYLDRVYREVLSEPALSLTVYGWGIGKQEQHILDRLRASGVRRVAVSVLNGDQMYARHAFERFGELGIEEIRFFDSASADAWNNPREETDPM